MNPTFKDNILRFYRRGIKKRPKLRLPLMALCVVLLAIDRFFRVIRSGKYVVVLMTLLFAFVSCSFSSVIWDGGEYDFTETTLAYYETEESYASLAVESEVDEESLELDDEEDENGDLENIEDVSTIDTVTGSDILDSMTKPVENPSDEALTNDGDLEVTFARDDWELVLVNKNHPISEDYEFTLGTIKGALRCDERIIPDLYAMMEGALGDGVNLLICSPYRDGARQQMLFDRKVARYVAQGMSYMDAYKRSAQTVTIPGTSEHEIGLALDIISDNYSSLNAGFGDTKAGKWLAEHSYEYGFIIRYPEGKEDVTGIEYEPWHFRYVGRNAARVIREESLTLEEFWEKYL